MPILRPFRALRFDAAIDLSAVLAPPYDIISPTQRRALLEQDPRNAVRLELPAEIGVGDDDAYRGAARTLAEWRSTRVLTKDREPTVTVHEMSWTDAGGHARSCTGFLARLRLEPFGPGAGVLPHERTMSAPKEDRYRLLKATGLNTSPIVLLAGSDAGATSAAFARPTRGEPDAVARTSDGVDHRLWVLPTPDPGLPDDLDRPEAATSTEGATKLLSLASSAPLTIADGHHRYETALRYRSERGVNRACESDPAWDYVMVLVYPVDRSPPALPTHRVLRGEPSGQELIDRLAAFARVEPVADPEALVARMAAAPGYAVEATGTGRIGLLTRELAAVLTLDRAARDALVDHGLSAASRGLDVNALSALIEQVFDAEPGSLADAGRLWYVKDADEASQQVAAGQASTAFLLDPMPPVAVARVAAAGEVMPHKSTYFDPKAPSGLLFSPMEW